MKKITPHLWFDQQAQEAARFYVSLFPDSRVTHVTTLHEVPTPTGDTDVVSFELHGRPFMAISAGPLFRFNPSISFFVNFDPSRDAQARKNLDALWGKLSEGGRALMPLDRYPFSEHYGWLQDRYGPSWQLILSDPAGEARPPIVPALLFVGAVAGRAVMFCDFALEGQWFAAMDSAGEHAFAFIEAISLLIPCETQQEIDYFWERLSADPNAEQCGWLKDRFGVSWQVAPTVMDEMMRRGTPEQIARVTKAFLPMKKFDIAALRRAYEGRES